MLGSSKGSYALIELVVVMIVMALMASWGMSGFVKTSELSKEKNTRIAAKGVADFLMQYAAAYKHLPCPARGDVENAIEEDCSQPCSKMQGVFCTDDFVLGVLPYASIFGNKNTGRKDGWGYKFTYVVHKNLALPTVTSIADLKSAIFVRTDGVIDFAKPDSSIDYTPIAFAVMSHGKLHRGAWNISGKQSSCTSAKSDDEIDVHNCTYTNLTNNQLILMYFAEHNIIANTVLGTKAGGKGKFFYDDIIEWRSMDALIAQLGNI